LFVTASLDIDFYQLTGTDQRQQTEFICMHWWIWSRSN